jgi:hypothetical protein
MGVNGNKFYFGRFLSCRTVVTEFACTHVCGVKGGSHKSLQYSLLLTFQKLLNLICIIFTLFLIERLLQVLLRCVLLSIVEMCLVKFFLLKLALKTF